MSKAIIWVGENCPKCDEVKAILASKGVEVEEKLAAGLTNGDEFNPTALKKLAAQNYSTPLVCLDDEFLPKDYKFI